ncbi:hypothetical protein niasHS_013621 [Heterodera schachtii]|uniref:Uncharacterized protein n=1 Tax=Heterodera schachtii TaxID=97005 RepID=A0ABD2IGG3_HETSC
MAAAGVPPLSWPQFLQRLAAVEMNKTCSSSAQMLWRNSALGMLNLKLVVVLVYERVAYCHAPEGLWPEEVSQPGNPECSCECLCTALGAVSSGEMVLPKSGKLGCLASAVSLPLARLPSPPMRTLALNGVVSAETIRLYKTAVIAALGNAR